MQAIDLILTLPLPLHKTTVQQAAEIVRDATLLDAQGLNHLADVMRPVAQQLHNSEAGLIRERAEELAIKPEGQAKPR